VVLDAGFGHVMGRKVAWRLEDQGASLRRRVVPGGVVGAYHRVEVCGVRAHLTLVLVVSGAISISAGCW